MILLERGGLPLARTSFLATPSSGDTPQRPELGPKKSLPNVKSIVPPFWVFREILWSFCWREYNCECSVFAIIYITLKIKGFNSWHVFRNRQNRRNPRRHSALNSKFGTPPANFGGTSLRRITAKFSPGSFSCATFQLHSKNATTNSSPKVKVSKKTSTNT